MKWTAEEAARITGGKLVSGSGRAAARGVSTDTRSLRRGEAFVPLRGRKFDGHDFLAAAFQKGAAWALKDRNSRPAALPASATVIEVEDTLFALGELARFHRRSFNLQAVGVTGSIGKSTVKEMIARILSDRGVTLKNQGNLNNRIGVPLTLLQLNGRHEFAVLEMGCNEPGEIGRLTQIAEPTAGLITCVAPVHLEGLGSLDGVAAAKTEMIRNLPPGAVFILNLDDQRIGRYTKNFTGRLIGFSRRPETDFPGESLHLTAVEKEVSAGRPRLRFEVQRKIRGKPLGRAVRFRIWSLAGHNAVNAVAAAAVARAFGIPLEEAGGSLAGFHGLAGRSEVLRSPRGAFIINDCYNSSPVALLHALETLNWWRGPRRGVAVLGEMLELGKYAERYHREAGEAVARKGITLFLAKGHHAQTMIAAAVKAGLPRSQARRFEENEEAVKILADRLLPGDWVLIKGSRAMGLESIVTALTK